MKTTLLISALAVSLNACAIDEVANDDITIDESEESAHEKLSANGMTPVNLAATTVGVAKLTTTYANAMAATGNGRLVLQYLVGCALSTGNNMTVSYSVGGVPTTATYYGQIGLFNSWKTITPALTAQRLISGCVLARMNETGATVTISIRGANAGYALQENEAYEYFTQEGAFFGNIFQGDEYFWGSCKGVDTTSADRLCAQDGHCSMTWAGNCADVCVASGDYFSSCTVNGVTWSTPAVTYLYSW
jgi:hypothetical protein